MACRSKSRLIASTVMVFVLGSCRAESPAPSAGGDRAAGALTPQAAAETVDALCEVRRDVSSDVSAAEAIFEDRAHSTLHLLAPALEKVDPAASARLLENMHVLESAFRSGKGGPSLLLSAERMLQAAISGFAKVGLRVTPCSG